jgi:hypothetical protein
MAFFKRTIAICCFYLIFNGCTSSKQSTQIADNYSNIIMNNCYNKIAIFDSLTPPYKKQLCLCTAQSITQKFNYTDFINLPKLDKELLFSDEISHCSKSNNISIIKQASTQISKKELPTADLMIGFWQANNSTYWLLENGTISIRWDNGQVASGKWWLDESGLFITKYSIRAKNKIYNTNLIYRFEHFSRFYMRYSTVNAQNRTVYEANRNTNYKP